MSKPAWEHDCPRCVYICSSLVEAHQVDFYYCAGMEVKNTSSIVWRWGPGPLEQGALFTFLFPHLIDQLPEGGLPPIWTELIKAYQEWQRGETLSKEDA